MLSRGAVLTLKKISAFYDRINVIQIINVHLSQTAQIMHLNSDGGTASLSKLISHSYCKPNVESSYINWNSFNKSWKLLGWLTF